jgi:hypothetical protein
MANIRTWPSQKWLVNGMFTQDSFSLSHAACLYGVWGRSHTVLQISLDLTGVFNFLFLIDNHCACAHGLWGF